VFETKFIFMTVILFILCVLVGISIVSTFIQ